jgi:hypothetical protein
MISVKMFFLRHIEKNRNIELSLITVTIVGVVRKAIKD